MSTKIYNGYVLPMMTLKELNAFTNQFRLKAQVVAKEEAEKLIAKLFAKHLDTLYLEEKEQFYNVAFKHDTNTFKKRQEKYEKGNVLYHLYQTLRIRYEHVQQTQIRDNQVDFDAEVVYIPLEDKILALYYAENEALQTLWENEELVNSYGYWNNTDPDETCTEEEWEQRRNDWDEALPGFTLPIQAGVTATFVKGFHPYHGLSETSIVAHLPSLEIRAKKYAKEEKFKQLSNQYAQDKKNTIYEILEKITSFLDSEEGQEQLRALEKSIKEQLCSVITEKHLSMTYQELKALQTQIN